MKTLLEHLDASADIAGHGKNGLLGVGIGAGLGALVMGGLVLALRYFVRPPTKESIPETISASRFTSHAFQTSHGQMVYHESGAGPGPTLIFIHNVGVGASSYEWSKVYPAFPDGHRVLAPDLLGFGESERPKVRLTAADYAESLAEFITHVCADEPQRPVVVARGLGAGFVALMAARHPDLAARLLLWMPSGRARVPALLNFASRLPNVNSFIYRNRLARRATIRRRFEAAGAFVEPGAVTQEMVEVHAICAQQYQADYAIYRLFQGKMSFDLDGCFREVQVPSTILWPTLLASGTAYTHTQRLQGSNRLCALRLVPGAGAFAPLEAPGGVVAVINEELQPAPDVLRAVG